MDAFIFICLILLAIVLVMTKEYVDSRKFYRHCDILLAAAVYDIFWNVIEGLHIWLM